MRIGIVCYASLGGSGIVATELARHLVRRNHEVHVISSEVPFRLQADSAGIVFHRVEAPEYPLFREPQYVLAVATRIVQVARAGGLDIVHAHYAVPHAMAAWIAREIIASGNGDLIPRIVTTLHGTDITLVGSDASYAEAVAFSIDRSDAVTAVSKSLRDVTCSSLPVRSDVRVIYNFLDCDEFQRRPHPELREQLCPRDRYDALIVHLSNFRPVKRVDAVVDIFRRIRQHVRARLVLAGDGPDAGRAQLQAEAYGLRDEVQLLPALQSVVGLLSVADLFLLPSLQESFGLAAVEAMACEVPVIASRVGGLPEVIEHGVTGFLHAPEDLEGMASSGVAVLSSADLRRQLGEAARMAVTSRFCVEEIVPQYESLYRQLIR
jgi:N-acetyl-alpha-D-glucosaminyl L-malate synthase BshA